ncbi:FCS-Like Zinc finger 8-like [Rhododendron vialii]|uniref:FCS-Like Zinc finger 8-like n=1 Tax=Rhododendron vialii TaxID=182163 RepID=UPI00265F973D|nr:FCS-Like Zinc finger 8-like [Rhododendron vialii]
MAEHGSIQSPKDKYQRPISSIFSSPRLINAFASKGLIDTEAVLSPTSILDAKPFSGSRNPFSPKSPKPEIRTHWEKLDSRKVGLGILDALIDEKPDQVSEPENRVVLFASQLKIKIPPLLLSLGESPRSPADFGIKTRNSQLALFSSGVEKKSPFGSASSGLENPFSPRVLSASEMELSEEYTRVVSYGPNPRTTHIFDDCVVESCCGVVGFSDRFKGDGFCGDRSMSYPSENFLSFCYSCKKNLGQGNDIYMYRGEKAFCSSECRYKEMMLDEKMENFQSDDVYGVSL